MHLGKNPGRTGVYSPEPVFTPGTAELSLARSVLHVCHTAPRITSPPGLLRRGRGVWALRLCGVTGPGMGGWVSRAPAGCGSGVRPGDIGARCELQTVIIVLLKSRFDRPCGLFAPGWSPRSSCSRLGLRMPRESGRVCGTRVDPHRVHVSSTPRVSSIARPFLRGRPLPLISVCGNVAPVTVPVRSHFSFECRFVLPPADLTPEFSLLHDFRGICMVSVE